MKKLMDLDEDRQVKVMQELPKRKINRRDAAKVAVVDALVDEPLMGKSVEALDSHLLVSIYQYLSLGIIIDNDI